MLSLLASLIKRLITATTSPFRVMLVRVQRLLNVNVISAKLITPLNNSIKKLLKLRPSEQADYVKIGPFLVFKKLFALFILVACAGVFFYFTLFAEAPSAPPVSLTGIKTDVTFSYDDMSVKDFTGTANIAAYDGRIVYTGQINSGVCEGSGLLYARDGSLLYEGDFSENRYNGRGVQYAPGGGVVYEGEFADNRYHGVGRLYNAAGGLLYTGGFAAGRYEGDGKLYDNSGGLIYEGAFSGGQSHGSGIQYAPGGLLRYRGEFYEGAFQGHGNLYDDSGRLIYTGAMQKGEIHYRALVGATLSDLDTAFAETPGIYYQENGESCFFYEKAGVVITADCRVRVYERAHQSADLSEGYYYMPGEAGGPAAVSPSAPPEGYSEYEAEPDDESNAGGATLSPVGSRVMYTSARSAGGAGGLTPMSWVVIDPYTPESAEDDDESASASEAAGSSSPSGSSSAPPIGSSAAAPRPDTSLDAPAGDTQATDGAGAGLPEFVTKTKELYFEIDADVWQSESELDKTKIMVKRVTVLHHAAPSAEAGAVSVEDSGAPGVEDCVAIDRIRLDLPTAFSDISFEIDKQNKLFGQVWNINYAGRVIRRAYMMGEMTYRFAYLPDNPDTLAYYSIEA